MRIGYQGNIGSNAETAARLFAEESAAGDVIALVPLTGSHEVVCELESGGIDVGVMALSNNIGGTVRETESALEEGAACLETLWEGQLEIHHCLFQHPTAIPGRATAIASHIQALRQCEGTLSKLFPDCELIETANTALAASFLADGILPVTTMVLCKRDCGFGHGLSLVRENMEDSPSHTLFAAFALVR